METFGEFCYLHPRTLAVERCLDCGKPICEVCLKRVNTKPYCEACSVNRSEQSPLMAFVFALLVPGMGQVYNGEWAKAAIVFVTGWLIVPWLYGIVDAIIVADEIKNGRRESTTVPPGYLLLVIKFGIIPFACLYFGAVLMLFSALFGVVRLLVG